MNITLHDLLDEGIWESAYTWLCKRRRNYPDHADVWNFRRHWKREIVRLRRELLEGSYRLGLLSRTTLESGEEADLFSARDALLFKALALVLGKRLSFSRHCTHLKGNGGGKGAVRRVWRHLKQHRFVIRTDVKSYYASIDHQHLIERLSRVIQDRRVPDNLSRPPMPPGIWVGLRSPIAAASTTSWWSSASERSVHRTFNYAPSRNIARLKSVREDHPIVLYRSISDLIDSDGGQIHFVVWIRALQTDDDGDVTSEVQHALSGEKGRVGSVHIGDAGGDSRSFAVKGKESQLSAFGSSLARHYTGDRHCKPLSDRRSHHTFCCRYRPAETRAQPGVRIIDGDGKRFGQIFSWLLYTLKSNRLRDGARRAGKRERCGCHSE